MNELPAKEQASARYFVRLQLVEQQGFDDDSDAKCIIHESVMLTPPFFLLHRAAMWFNTVKLFVSSIRNLKDYMS